LDESSSRETPEHLIAGMILPLSDWEVSGIVAEMAAPPAEKVAVKSPWYLMNRKVNSHEPVICPET